MKQNIKQISNNLLVWYDENARVLPWRCFGKEKVDPYKVWISEIMLQQTSVITVTPYFKAFFNKWPTVTKLSEADLSEVLSFWSGLGYYSRARNLLKCAVLIVSDYNGKLPENEKELLKLPGIGVYTSAAILAIAFNKYAVVVDGNIKRIISRIFSLKTPIESNYKEIWSLTKIITPDKRFGDFAQSMMDLGSKICTPTSPKCNICPISKNCLAKINNMEHLLPIKLKKILKPIRNGNSYIIKNKNKILLYKRPNKGLLAGLVSIPSGEWDNYDDARLKFINKFKKHKFSQIKHEFTHFKLKMEIYCIDYNIPHNAAIKIPSGFNWYSFQEIKNLAMPSLMKKIFKTMSFYKIPIQ